MEILTIKGGDLEERLDSGQMEDFEVLLRQYIEDVSAELPNIVNLNPPGGIRDVIQQVDMLSVGGNPKFTDTYLLAVEGEYVVGILSFMANEKRLFETHRVVLRDYRRRGIGKSLVKEFLTYARIFQADECVFKNSTMAAYLSLIQAAKEEKLPYESKVVVKLD